MLIFLAIFLGLLVNYFTGGLPFFSLLCIFAGIFLIMPSLLKFEWKDFLDAKKHWKLMLTSLFINFLFVPGVFFSVAYLFLDVYYLKYAFLLLGLLSGGGLLMSWIMKTNGDSKLGFQLFMLNFTFFSLVIFYPLNTFLENEASMKTLPFLGGGNVGSLHCVLDSVTGGAVSCVTTGGNVSPIFAFFVLIIIPFILSRLLRYIPKLNTFLEKHIARISQIASFIVIFYIFSLKEVHQIFERVGSDIFFLLSIALSLLLAYLLIGVSLYGYYIFSAKKKEAKSIVWVSFSRFITLGLVFSFIYSTLFSVDFLLVFVCAYFIQIFLSLLLSSLLRDN